jgi:NifU-like protein involved in Fe-S cluster formation
MAVFLYNKTQKYIFFKYHLTIERKVLSWYFYKMINEDEYDEVMLGELNAYSEIYMQPNRKKCAIFPFETLKKAIKKYKENN